MDIVEHYSRLFQEHGDSPQSVQLADRTSQFRRFEVLTKDIPRKERVSVMDVGCGLGHLNEFFAESGRNVNYSGIDVTPDFVTACQSKFPKARFAVHDISSSPPEWSAEYLVLNGVFNNHRDDAADFMFRSLRNMYSVTTKFMTFNFMSTYVDFQDNQLVYFHPETVFRFCKEELSPLVELNHGYCVRDGIVPFEAVVTVHKTAIVPRPRLETACSAGSRG